MQSIYPKNKFIDILGKKIYIFINIKTRVITKQLDFMVLVYLIGKISYF